MIVLWIHWYFRYNTTFLQNVLPIRVHFVIENNVSTKVFGAILIWHLFDFTYSHKINHIMLTTFSLIERLLTASATLSTSIIASFCAPVTKQTCGSFSLTDRFLYIFAWILRQRPLHLQHCITNLQGFDMPSCAS